MCSFKYIYSELQFPFSIKKKKNRISSTNIYKKIFAILSLVDFFCNLTLANIKVLLYFHFEHSNSNDVDFDYCYLKNIKNEIFEYEIYVINVNNKE